MSRQDTRRYGLLPYRKTTASFDNWVKATLKPETVEALKARPDGSLRLVVHVFAHRKRSA